MSLVGFYARVPTLWAGGIMNRTMIALFLAMACNGGGGRADTILALNADLASGETLYGSNCASCHGVDGSGGVGSSIKGSDVTVLVDAVLAPPSGMTDLSGSLSDQDIADIAGFAETL